MTLDDIGHVDIFVLDVLRLAKPDRGIAPLIACFHQFRDERRAAAASDCELQGVIATAENQLGEIEATYRANREEPEVVAQGWATAISALRVIMHGENRTTW